VICLALITPNPRKVLFTDALPVCVAPLSSGGIAATVLTLPGEHVVVRVGGAGGTGAGVGVLQTGHTVALACYSITSSVEVFSVFNDTLAGIATVTSIIEAVLTLSALVSSEVLFTFALSADIVAVFRYGAVGPAPARLTSARDDVVELSWRTTIALDSIEH